MKVIAYMERRVIPVAETLSMDEMEAIAVAERIAAERRRLARK